MKHLKDVGGEAPTDGMVYMYNGSTGQFEPFDLRTALGNVSTLIENMNATINGFNSRVTRIENALIPPAGAPDDARIVFGNINEYSDPNVVISEGSGTVTTLDKTHGFYSHALADDAYGDEIFG